MAEDDTDRTDEYEAEREAEIEDEMERVDQQYYPTPFRAPRVAGRGHHRDVT
ncbi:hypothetical protein RBH26_04305 [Natronolimnohabitans sp. A-GB9]|uniref:hypothetical protein n=1 Tax=Natronolimnohabitans sp. A-GB9 TaxID=3069757 RepID=UPI0027B564A1|nr:hypothetical protein [Natronolimnohabitans sp. A-GB9]MDQ2049700.1 hypothetical protein [Natronolimnohabitans sp. A-GB9]